MIDFLSMSCGGVLLDGSGDIALNSDPMVSITDIIRSRLKADIDGWKLYRIGADLNSFIGTPNNEELETAIKRRVTSCLNNNFLPQGSFSVKTLRTGDSMNIFVYINNTMVVSAIVSLTNNSQSVSVS